MERRNVRFKAIAFVQHRLCDTIFFDSDHVRCKVELGINAQRYREKLPWNVTKK